jgi:hypothetical protein
MVIKERMSAKFSELMIQFGLVSITERNLPSKIPGNDAKLREAVKRSFEHGFQAPWAEIIEKGLWKNEINGGHPLPRHNVRSSTMKPSMGSMKRSIIFDEDSVNKRSKRIGNALEANEPTVVLVGPSYREI